MTTPLAGRGSGHGLFCPEFWGPSEPRKTSRTAQGAVSGWA